MLRFCGQCGYSLTATMLQAERCAQCGAALDASADLPTRAAVIASADDPTRPSADSFLADVDTTVPDAADTHTGDTGYTPAQQPVDTGRLGATAGREWPLRRRQPTRPQRRQLARWALALLFAVPLVLAVTSAAVLHQTGALTSFRSSLATSPARPAARTTARASVGTRSTVGSPSPTASATASATASPTVTPVPASLSVYPTTFSFLTCTLGQTIHFTVANTGGTAMPWSASATVDTYGISPSSGTIDAEGNQTVQVDNIDGSGTVTVSAPIAHNSPQHVTITCTV